MHKQSNKMKKYIARFFLVAIVLALVLNVFVPDKDMSDLENRSLAQFPSQIDSDFGKNLQSYYSDQFVGRNTFIHLNYVVQKLSGVSKIQGVYLGKHQLIEECAKVNEEQEARNLTAINSFAQKHKDLNVKFMLVPNAISIQQDKLPLFASDDQQNTQMDHVYDSLDSSIKKVDIRNRLKKHSNEYLYYKTDHHWTSLGAYYGAKALNSNIDLANYNKMAVSNTFKGSLESKTGSLLLKDEIDIYPPANTDYIVTYNSTKKTTRSIYQSKALDQKDQYQVFFGGNEGMINIGIDNDSDKNLLIIKDSYANEIVQFLLPYYQSITIIDPRYYFDDIEKQLTRDLTTDVLFLYNSNTFVEDTSLADCIGE